MSVVLGTGTTGSEDLLEHGPSGRKVPQRQGLCGWLVGGSGRARWRSPGGTDGRRALGGRRHRRSTPEGQGQQSQRASRDHRAESISIGRWSRAAPRLHRMRNPRATNDRADLGSATETRGRAHRSPLESWKRHQDPRPVDVAILASHSPMPRCRGSAAFGAGKKFGRRFRQWLERNQARDRSSEALLRKFPGDTSFVATLATSTGQSRGRVRARDIVTRWLAV